MFRRTAAFILLIWLFGFLWFAVSLPQPAEDERTDAVIVLTGGAGRIPHGIDIVRKGLAPRLLVSGVDPEVRQREFAKQFGVSDYLMKCCITLGYTAFDTRSNAVEAVDWLQENKARSVRLVTSDWHMRRSAYELLRAMPKDIVLVRDAVRSYPSLQILFLEYHKLLARNVIDILQRLRK